MLVTAGCEPYDDHLRKRAGLQTVRRAHLRPLAPSSRAVRHQHRHRLRELPDSGMRGMLAIKL
jgi:hypothetical protein